MARTWFGHFDSTPDGPRMLMAEDWANYIQTFITNGIRNGGTNLQVSAGNGMRIRIDEGRANIEGYLFMIEADDAGRYYELELPPSHPVSPRVDRIVLRLDRRLDTRDILPQVLQGDAGANPQPKPLTRNNIVWELSLAQIRVAPQTAGIVNTNITDERFNTNLCGIINSILGLDPSNWQNQFDEFFNAFIEATHNRDEEFINEWWLKFQRWFEDVGKWTESQEDYFTRLGNEIRDLIQALETGSFTLINNNFDDWSVRRGCDKVTEFNADGSITETIRVVALDFVLAAKETVFNADGSIMETITFNPWEHTENNVTTQTTALVISKQTIFNADGSIREAIR